MAVQKLLEQTEVTKMLTRPWDDISRLISNTTSGQICISTGYH